ncbi:MAG TPA: TolC family protein [Polyangiales bacterium]|nr:TolC family protein [Polyangiales bacterium]
MSLAAAQAAPALDLRAVVARARRDPPATLAAIRNVEARRHEEAAARHAWLPVVALEGRGLYAHSYQHSEALTARGGDTNLHAELVATLNLVDFGRRGHRADAARHALDAAREGLHGLQLQAAVEASRLYLQVLADQALLQVLRTTFEDRSSLLEAVQALAQRGLRPDVEVVRTRAEVTRARLDISVQEQRMGAGRAALATALGLRSTADFVLRPSSEAEFQVNDELERALVRTLGVDAELRAARSNRAAALARAEAARSDLYPELDAVGSAVSDHGQRWYGNVPEAWGVNVGVGLTVRWTMLDVSSRDRAATAASDASAAAATLAQTELERRLDVTQTVYAVREARAALEQADELTSAYELTVQAERERYMLGEASLLEVLTAADNLQRVRASQISARFAHDGARVKLKLLVEGHAAFAR